MRWLSRTDDSAEGGPTCVPVETYVRTYANLISLGRAVGILERITL